MRKRNRGNWRRLALAAVTAPAILVATVVTEARAGMVAPCIEPLIFQNADVNLVLLPYALNSPDLRLRQDSFALWENEGAGALASLIQFETLYSLRYPASLAVVQLFAEGGDCPLEDVKRKVADQLGPGKGAVFLWGGLVEHGGEIFIQSYVEFFRKDRADLLHLQMPAPVGAAGYEGGIPQRGIGFPPKILTAEDVGAIRQSAETSRMLSSSPGGPPEIRLPEAPFEPFAFTVLEINPNGWMRIKAAASEEHFREPGSMAFEGWLSARPGGSLRGLLPELDFVDGAIGFLVGQIIEEERTKEHWAGDWVSRYYRARNAGSAALGHYVDAVRSDGGEVDIDVASSVSLAETMRAAMALNGPPVEPAGSEAPAKPTAATLIEAAIDDLRDANRLVPYQAATRNLLAIGLSALAAVEGDEELAKDAVAEWSTALSLAPNDRAIAGNVATYYLSAKEAGRPDLVGLTATEIDDWLTFLAH